jgi:hypothetical protein
MDNFEDRRKIPVFVVLDTKTTQILHLRDLDLDNFRQT